MKRRCWPQVLQSPGAHCGCTWDLTVLCGSVSAPAISRDLLSQMPVAFCFTTICSLLFQTQQLGARGKYPGPTATPGLPEEVRTLQHVWGGGEWWREGGSGSPGVRGLGCQPGPLVTSALLCVKVEQTLRSQMGGLPASPLLASAVSRPKESLRNEPSGFLHEIS